MIRDEKDIPESGKNFIAALMKFSKALWPEHVPTRDEVKELAMDLAKKAGLEAHAESWAEEAYYAIDSRMGLGVSLIDLKASHDEEWVHNRGIEWIYSNAYEHHLENEKWSPTVVQSLSDVAEKILGHLQDPASPDVWDRRGLVIGHVQSGKTANYLGLITKAADAGYKFFIVIAGVHNNLRKQTQERVDEGFIGRTKEGDKWKTVGVGHGDYPHPVTLTNIYADFDKKTADQSGWSISDISKPVILVIKKNVSILTSLYRWLDELNSKGDGKIKDIPMLMIDDEADNASINTKKEDNDPTQTNRRIREILSLFDKSGYIGYTATPFANIFINPDAYGDEKLREELFPKDFIYCLDAPTTYFGPDKVFLDDNSSDRILETINDAEDCIPLKHEKNYEVPDLPPSLRKAIRQFVVVKAIRDLRGHVARHSSMLVNVSRFISVQKLVQTHINLYLKKLKEAIKANYLMPDSVSQKNERMEQIRSIFAADFESSDLTWDNLKPALFNSVSSIRTFAVNSKSEESLDYRKYEREERGLTAIAVGGLSLSRGLTIEGLCISYMYRNTRMYDTLMQMGRWFGYRPGYDELCRVHLSKDSINWYSHIAESSEELREQIRQMRRDGLSPKKFGLYVKAHPDSLLVTAPNKMRAGEKLTFKHNFSGRLVESYALSVDDKVSRDNRDLVYEYRHTGFGKGNGVIEETTKGWIIRDVDLNQVGGFLNSFRAHESFSWLKSAVVKYIKSISRLFPVADVLLISANEGAGKTKGALGPQLRKTAEKREGDYWRLAKERVASRGDEKLGLDDDQIKEAKELAAESGKKPSDFHYRSIRKKPLLMIHSLNLGDGENSPKEIPAFGISFPPGDYSEGVSVVANTVLVKKLHDGISDAPENEDDDE